MNKSSDGGRGPYNVQGGNVEIWLAKAQHHSIGFSEAEAEAMFEH